MAQNECCFFSRGELLISEPLNDSGYGNNWGQYYGGVNANFPRRYNKLGNVRTFSLNISSDFVASNSYQGQIFNTPDCAGVIINDIDFNLELNCFSFENLTRAMYGNQKTNSLNGSITDKIIENAGSFAADTFFALPYLGPSNLVLKIVDENLADVSTLVLGTDYKLDNDGITLLLPLEVTGTNLLSLSYDYNESSEVIDAFTGDIGPRSLLFRGINHADSGYDFNIEIYKTKMKPMTNLDFINQQDLGSILIEGKVMKDFTRNEEALSQYMLIKKFER